jgi:hypothetical protein
VQYGAYLPTKRYTDDHEDSPLRVTFGSHVSYIDTEAFAFDPDKKRVAPTVRRLIDPRTSPSSKRAWRRARSARDASPP